MRFVFIVEIYMRNRNILRFLICTLLVLIIAQEQLAAQCISVTVTGPKCATDGSIIGNFGRRPFIIEWAINSKVVKKSTSIWTTLATSSISGNITGSSNQKRIRGTGGLGIDVNGSILVVDTLNNRVSGFNRSNVDGVRVAGGNGTGIGLNQLNKPSGIFVDGFGNLFITDQLNNRVMRYAPGSNSGFLVAGGNGAGSRNNQLNNPKDVFVDAAGFVYIADEGNNRIQKWAQGGSVGETVAGGFGVGSDSTKLNSPQGVCVDQFFNIYVADSANHRIQKFEPGSRKGITVAGGFGRGSNENQLNQPVDVLVDAFFNIYVLDAGNHRVQSFSADRLTITTLAGNPSGFGGSENDQLLSPSAISFDPSGNLYVLDQQNARVQQYNTIPLATTLIPTTEGVYNAIAYSFNGCRQVSNGVFVLANTSIQVTGNTSLCKGDSAFIKLSGAGNYNWSPSKGVTKVNDSVYLVVPDSSIVYNVNSINVNTCTTNNNITFSVGEKIVPFITATECAIPSESNVKVRLVGGIPASLNWFTRSGKSFVSLPSWSTEGVIIAGGNGAGATPAQLILPTSVFVDAKGNTYVADPLNHRIQLWNKGDLVGATILGGKGAGSSADQLNYPTGVYVDLAGNIYVADQNNHRVQYFVKSSIIGRTIIGGNGAGNNDNQLNFPYSVFVDVSGSVYVSDAGNHRIIRLPAIGKNAYTIAGTGIAGSSNNQLNNPQGIFVDRNFRLFIADAGNHRVMMFNKDQEFGASFAGGRGIGNDQRQLNAPSGLFVDGVGNIYIADRGNSRIQRWAAYDSIGVTIVGNVNGSLGTNLTQINQPSALTIDNNGGLFVADARNNRILKFEALKSIDTLLKVNKSDEFSVNTYSFNGCSTGSNFAKLKVAAPINFITKSSVICEGTGTLITAKSDSLSSYTWTPSTGLNVTNKDNVIASPKTTTKYTVKTAVIDGCQSSSSITVKVNKLPVVNIEGVNCIGGGDLKANSSPKASSVTWKFNNNNIRTTSTLWRSGATIVAGNLIGGFDSSKLGRPTFVFVDEKGSMYICDQWNHRIQKWEQGATAGKTVAGGKGAGNKANQLNNPSSIYVDSKGIIYIADTDNNRIQKWTVGDTSGVTVAGGKGKGAAKNQLSYPTSVYLDPYDNIYVADAENSRIQKWIPGGLEGVTVAGGDFAGADSSKLFYPLGVFVDGKGNVYVADSQNDRIQRWAPDSTRGVTVAGGKRRGTNTNQLNLPLNIYVGDDNIMYITEGGSANRIKRWILGDTTGVVIAGGASVGNNAQSLNAPGNAMIDANGSLFVSDMNNFRVQRFSLADTSFPITPQKGAYQFVSNSFAGCIVNSGIQNVDSGFIPAPPIVADKKYCLNDPSLPLTVTPPLTDSIIWYTLGTGGVGSATAPRPTTNIAGSTNYWAARINALRTCESARQKLNVLVNPLPGANLRAIPKQNLLPGDTAFLQLKADSGRSISRVLWYKNGSLQFRLPDTTATLKVFYNGVGKYYAEIIDANTCSSKSDTIEIKGEIAQQLTMFLFPNPVQNTTKLIFTAIPNATTYVKVISINGIIMMNQKIPTVINSNTVYDLDLSNLNTGTYDIQLISGSGKMISSKRVIKL